MPGNIPLLLPHLAGQMCSLSCGGGVGGQAVQPPTLGPGLVQPSPARPRPGPSGLHLAAPWPSAVTCFGALTRFRALPFPIRAAGLGIVGVRGPRLVPGQVPPVGHRGSAPAWAPAGARRGVTSRSPPPRPSPLPFRAGRAGPAGAGSPQPPPQGPPLPSGRASAPRVPARPDSACREAEAAAAAVAAIDVRGAGT